MKQVIVMRKDLNMRKGKMVAQGCHATIAVLLELDISDKSLEDMCIRNLLITYPDT